MSPNTVRKLPPAGPTLCDPATVAACMKRMDGLDQRIRELTEAVQALTRSTERRNEALANLEKRFMVGGPAK